MGRWIDKAKEMEAARKAEQSPLAPIEQIRQNCVPDSISPARTETAFPRFVPGQHVLVTDNEDHIRSGLIQFVGWIDEPSTVKGHWYCILDVYGHLSETHESRLSETGLMKKTQA